MPRGREILGNGVFIRGEFSIKKMIGKLKMALIMTLRSMTSGFAMSILVIILLYFWVRDVNIGNIFGYKLTYSNKR